MTLPLAKSNALDRLFDQRFLAMDILTTDSDKLQLSRNRLSAINSLKSANAPSELIRTPELIPLLPLLGALDRNDAVQTQTALEVLELDEAPRGLLWRLLPNYLSILVFVYLAVFGFLAYFVMPIFDEMFQDFRLRLPTLTAISISLSRIFRDYTGLIVIGSVTTYLAWGIAVPRGKITYYLSRLPWVGLLFAGNPYSLKEASKVSLITAELIDCQLSPATALAIASGKPLISGAELSTDTTLVDPPAVTSLYAIQLPVSIQQLLRQSPVTKSQTNSIRDFAQIYAQRATISKSHPQDYLMLLGILFMGALVALTIISLFLPLISLITSLS